MSARDRLPPPLLRVRARHLLNPMQRLVLYELWFDSEAGTREVECGQRTYGQRLGLAGDEGGKSLVRRTIMLLIELGWIERDFAGPASDSGHQYNPSVVRFVRDLNERISADELERDRLACLRGRNSARTRRAGNEAHDMRDAAPTTSSQAASRDPGTSQTARTTPRRDGDACSESLAKTEDSSAAHPLEDP